MSDKALLLEMGYPAHAVEKALKATKNSGLQPALDWLEAHAGNYDDDEKEVNIEKEQDEEEGAPAVTDADAKSLKCDDCGKLLKSPEAAQLHAHKTGHSNFSQSIEEVKPLTEEEKKEKLEELKRKLAEKKALKEAEEIAEKKEAEKLRRITGKDITLAKEKQKELEMKKAFELKKKEQQEEKEHKAWIKAQIEADKKARAEKALREKQAREGIAPVPVSAPKPVKEVVDKDYQETRIQVRVPGQSPLTVTFKADDSFMKLLEFLSSKGYLEGSFSLQTTFPKKTFTKSDYDKTFKELSKFLKN